MQVDDETQESCEEAPYWEKGLRIEEVGEEKGEEHRTCEDTDLHHTREHSTPTGRDEVEWEAQHRKGYAETIEDALTEYLRWYGSDDDTSEEWESDNESYESRSREEFFAKRVLLDQSYREGHIYRPEYIGEDHEGIGRDRMEWRGAECDPHDSLDPLLDTEEEGDQCKWEKSLRISMWECTDSSRDQYGPRCEARDGRKTHRRKR